MFLYMTRICERCMLEKPIKFFNKAKDPYLCKTCKHREYIQLNPEKYLAYQKTRKDVLNSSPIKKSISNLKVTWNHNKRLKQDPIYLVRTLVRRRLHKAFQLYSNGKELKCNEYGIDFQAIFDHVGPRPDKTFQLDHIIPISKFDFNNLEHIKLCHLPENFRWVSAKENLEKSDKVLSEFSSCPVLAEILKIVS